MNDSSNETRSIAGVRAAVIGAGMSGMLMAIRLEEAGVSNIVILEKADNVGGTWRDNSYPGLHCDVPSHFYRYSFHPNPDWTEFLSSGPEILKYFEDTAVRYGLIDKIHFGAAVIDARWDSRRWNLVCADGRHFEADIVVAATGFLHNPHYPDIPGLDDFSGPKFHTARWDHGASLADKRIGLVGTGSTSVQIVSALAGKVRKLTLFQRTAQWVMKQENRDFTDDERATFRSDPKLMETAFAEIRQQFMGLTDGAIQGRNPAARAELEANVEANLATVRDPELRRKLTPDYKVGCKRIVISPSFYEAIQHPDCELVTDKIARIEARGIRTTNGTLHELDVLVLATGFKAHDFFLPMKLYGNNGESIDHVWRDRPVALHSIAIPQMPNFFMVGGPFSPFGNISAIHIAERQADYIMKCVKLIIDKGIALSPRVDVAQTQVAAYREALKGTIWMTGGCQSWYFDKDGTPVLYPYSTIDFENQMARNPDLADYEQIALPA
jgi:cation diffusion facilitator CzcD-associated flavoprotein CzcO